MCLKKMMRYKHSIASVSLSGTLREKMIAIAKAGYDCIELFEPDFRYTPYGIAQNGSRFGHRNHCITTT
jgi:sugar phosphate isomerase/epimerase